MKQPNPLYLVCFLLTLTVSENSHLQAQLPAPSSKPQGAPIKTTVSVTLLTETTGAALFAQEWGRIFRDLKISIRTRRSVLDDKPAIDENVRGTFREVRLVGVLDRKGEIHFPGHQFARRDIGKLKEWLNELKTYGAQGSPDSKPVWGLSTAQFKMVFEALAEPAPVNVQGLSLKAAIKKLDLPETLPVRFSIAADQRLAKDSQATIVPDLEKLAKGTVLAIILKQYGLAFYPSRTPSTSLELAVTPVGATRSPWPIGWDLKLSRKDTAPRYFQLIPVELNNVPLRDVLLAASNASGIPIIADEYEIKKKNVDLDEITVTIPKKQTTWGILIGKAIGRKALTRKLMIDERGQPFVWITVFKPRTRPTTR